MLNNLLRVHANFDKMYYPKLGSQLGHQLNNMSFIFIIYF